MIEFWSVKFTPDQRAVRKIRTHPCRRARTDLRNAPLELILRFREGPAIRPNIWAKNRNFCIFHFFQKNEIFRKCFAKISVTKFREWKIWDCYLLRFSALFVVVYSVFSVDAFFTEKIAKQNGLFQVSSKNPKFLEKFATFSIFFGHPVKYFFTYRRSRVHQWPEKKDPVKFRAKLRSGEGVEHDCFCDIRLIGMYNVHPWWIQPYMWKVIF